MQNTSNDPLFGELGGALGNTGNSLGRALEAAYGVGIVASFTQKRGKNMYRGTTPTHTFSIPFDVSEVREVMVIYAQNDVEVFHKDTWECTMEGDKISVTLTQEDTFKLSHASNVQIQLRLLTNDGNALASDVATVSVQKCLNDEVL